MREARVLGECLANLFGAGWGRGLVLESVDSRIIDDYTSNSLT
jgi:hypothetical protein